MKTISKYLKPFLFGALVICSISCSLFLNSVNKEVKRNGQAAVVTEQEQEEVSIPDVFAVKKFIEKIVKYLPAS